MQNLKGSCSEKTWQPLSVPVWYLPHLSICLCIVFLPLLECKHYESRIKNFFPLFIILSLVSSHFIYLKNFNWTIVELQCCVNYCCTVKWLSYTHIYILFHIFFQYGLSQNIEYSSLCYTIRTCCLSIPYIPVCIKNRIFKNIILEVYTPFTAITEYWLYSLHCINTSLYLSYTQLFVPPTPSPYIAPPFFPLFTDNHQLILYITESALFC